MDDFNSWKQDDRKYQLIFESGFNSDDINLMLRETRNSYKKTDIENPYTSIDNAIGHEIYSIYGPWLKESSKTGDNLYYNLTQNNTDGKNNFRDSLIKNRGIDIESNLNRFATVLPSILHKSGYFSILLAIPIFLIIGLGGILAAILIPTVEAAKAQLDNKNIPFLRRLMKTAFKGLLTFIFNLTLALPCLIVSPILTLMPDRLEQLNNNKSGYLYKLRFFLNFPKYVSNFILCFKFSTLDKGNIPYPSKYKIYNMHEGDNTTSSTTIMEMGVPIYFNGNIFNPKFKIEPLFEQAVETMEKDKESWIYVNYLENKLQEEAMNEVLKKFEDDHSNFYYIQMPPHNQMYKLLKRLRGKDTTEIQISMDELFEEIINHQRIYCISDKVWGKALGEKEVSPKKKETFLKGIIESYCSNKNKFDILDLKRFNAHLTESIRALINPSKMNFTCKDGIDRGHVGKSEYLIENHAHKGGQILVSTHDKDPKKNSAILQSIYSDRHTRALQVKLREGNHHIHKGSNDPEDFEDFCKKFHRGRININLEQPESHLYLKHRIICLTNKASSTYYSTVNPTRKLAILNSTNNICSVAALEEGEEVEEIVCAMEDVVEKFHHQGLVTHIEADIKTSDDKKELDAILQFMEKQKYEYTVSISNPLVTLSI